MYATVDDDGDDEDEHFADDDVEDDSVAEDEVEKDDVAEDEVEKDHVPEDELEDDDVEDDMLRTRMSRGRKRMILRMMILRMLMWKRTNPKTAPHVLCEPAPSKCTSTCRKPQEHTFCRNLQEKCRATRPGTLCEPSRNWRQHVTRTILY